MNNPVQVYEQTELVELQRELEAELIRLNKYWLESVMLDDGFVGQVAVDDTLEPGADKGIILVTRMLWFFSEAAIYLKDDESKSAAGQLFRYIQQYFVDPVNGGVYWKLNADGKKVDGRKQVYAQAFAIYSLSAFYRLTEDVSVLALAREIYALLENKAYDPKHGGYFEAFSESWGLLDDIRLSTKDLPSPKTMNTHLHVLEAYTGLYFAEKQFGHSPNLVQAEKSLSRVIGIYVDRFFNKSNAHLRMFLSEDWKDESLAYSYGHDIESSWLLHEALSVLGCEELNKRYGKHVIDLVESCFAQGIVTDGSVCEEYSFATKQPIIERPWWVQVEAMVGFMNAWQLEGKNEYLSLVFDQWTFVKNELIDVCGGEWHWMAQCDQTAEYNTYKVGFWKGPYHNGRALIEICQRIEALS